MSFHKGAATCVVGVSL